MIADPLIARTIGIPFAGHEPEAMSAIELSNAGQRSIEHSRIVLLNNTSLTALNATFRQCRDRLTGA